MCPRSEVPSGRERGLARMLGFLFNPSGRIAVALLWLALVAGGLAVMKDFLAELEANVPAVPGTVSYEAQDTMLKFFPVKTVQNAVLVQSKDKQPLVNFLEGSTCKLELQLANGTGYTPDGFGLTLVCQNLTALGGGCIRSADLLVELEQLVEKLVSEAESGKLPFNISKDQGDSYIDLFKIALPMLAANLPEIDHCPLQGAGTLTKDWHDLVESINRTLVNQFPQCEHQIVSFLSAPEKSVSKTVNLGDYGLGTKNLTITAVIPAGNFWDFLRTQILTPDGATMLVAAITNTCDGKAVLPGSQPDKDVAKALEVTAKTAPTTLMAKVSSQSVMMDAIQAGITETMDLSTLTLPFALLILAGMAGNLRLIICTLVNLIACLAAAILFMYPVAKQLTVSTTAPSLMIAVALGMSIDYSLFLLTRFQKEVNAGRPAERAAEIMLGTSGKIVLVSGMTLLLCFLMMLVLPASFIATMGVSAAFTVFTAITAALTLTPTLLLTFPSFFGSSRNWGLSTDGCCCRRVRARSMSSGPMEGMSANLNQSHSNSELDHTEVLNQAMAKSCWPKYGAAIQRFSLPVLLVLVAIAVPFGILSLPKLGYSAGLVPFMPADADATLTVHSLVDAFGSGALFPTTLLIVPPRERVATNDAQKQWLTDSCEALRMIAHDVNSDPDVPPFTPAAFTGAMMISGNCSQLGAGIGQMWSDVGGEYAATKVTVSYQVDPFSTQGQAWVTRMRDALSKHPTIGTWYLAGEGPNQMDAAHETFKAFPFMIALMMGVVLVLIGISFKSLIAPFRAVFCLLWMLVMTFGAAICVFQMGALEWLDFSQLGQRNAGAMSWMSPMISFPVIVGLGLDYDIFFTECVLEECEYGYCEQDAVIRALTDTANTISAAGLIMMLAFGALLLCSTPTLNEIAFLLILGILIDCFITTKVIMPAAMYWLGRLNFWPHKLPKQGELPPPPRPGQVIAIA